MAIKMLKSHNFFNIKYSLIVGTSITLQLLAYILYYVTDSYIFLGMYFLAIVPNLILLFRYKLSKSFIALISILLLFFMAASYMSQTYPLVINLYNIIYGINSLIAAFLLYKNDEPEKYIKIVFWFLTAIIYYHIFKFGLSNPDLYNEVFAKSSRNYVSASYVIILCLLALCYEKKKETVPLIYALLTTIACVFLFGRSGIALSFLITLFVLIRQKNYYLIGISTTVLVIVLLANLSLIENFVFEKTNFSTGLESERSIFLNEYLNHITYSTYDLFFGRSINHCCTWITLFNGNPHNSFIMGHIRYGLLHTLFTLAILIYIISSKNLTLIFFGLIILSRFFTDQLGLFTGFDIALYFLLFLVYQYKKYNR
ncbi:hypothetical protein [Acinetobacter baumannii]|uniref:hypothetical protein n=1 Tax=Acinetobacter baumannii TaxID=470 RepID=UPI0004530D0E|nr:hypothetical protein [Acinetobacter baumannii]EXB32802.1 putative membrane protein [Acinetobacter baumannii 1419130]